MKLTLLACCLLFLPAAFFCQTSDPVLDSLKQPLPKGATARQQAERLQAILWRLVRRSEDVGAMNFPNHLDSLYNCCIAGKTGDPVFEKTLAADATLFRGSNLINTDPEKAKPLLGSAIRQFRAIGDSAKTALGYMQLCWTVTNLGDSIGFARIREQIQRLMPLVRDPYTLVNIHCSAGIGCYDFGRYAEAASHYFEALKIIESEKTAELMTAQRDIYHNLGGVYGRLGDWDNSLLYIRKAIESAKQTQQDTLDHYLILAKVLIEKKDYVAALKALKLTQNYEFARANTIGMSENAYSQAICYRNLGHRDTALLFAQKSVNLLPVSVSALYGAKALLELATCEFVLGKNSALQQARTAFKTFEGAKNSLSLARASDLLSKIYKSKRNYAKALEYSELRYKYQQQIERQQSTRQLAFGEFTRDNEVKNARREAEIEAQLTRQRNIRYTLLAGLAVLALLAFLLYNRYRYKQRSAEQLEAKNREVEAARARAEASEAFKSRFLANMSHEIRTPLHGIAGFTDLLLETSLTENQRRWLSSIRHSTDRLGEVVNDILNLSKLEAGEVKLRQVPFSPARVAADVQEALALRAENKGIELRLDVAADVPPALLGDPTRLYQILMNLAGNAVKFTERGKVTVAIDRVTPSHPVNTAALQFRIHDTGIGIPPEKLSAIFESFRQASDDTTAHFGGTGLGLSIARELVQLHGSDIQVESTVGKGSIFSFALSLPLADPADLEPETAKGGDLYFTQPLRILLADDNALNREIATGAIRKHFENAEITEAATGRQVIDWLASQPFDLILMDMQMPEMSGTEATHYIRENISAEIPIIALTASATREEIGRALDAGMNRHLAKPFKAQELAQAIAGVQGLIPAPEPRPAAVAPPEPPHIVPDLAFLRDFCDGDEAQVQYFLQKFQEQYPFEIEKLETALGAEDRETLYRAAHSFRPQLEFIGLPEAAGLVLRLEQGAHDNCAFGELTALLQQVKAALQRLRFDHQ